MFPEDRSKLGTMPAATFEVCASPAGRVATIVREAAADAIKVHGAFSIAIAGGSLVKMLGAMADLEGVEWEKWHVAWVDERCVSHSDPESNYGGALEAWLSKVPIPASQVHAISDELIASNDKDTVASVTAQDYERRLKAIPEKVLLRGHQGLPIFDLLLLGFGPDGHICSLFPGHMLLDDTSNKWILPISDSPKPPPERITLSLPAVNNATKVVLVGLGESKAEVVKSVVTSGCDLPCARVRNAHDGPTWVLDAAAAGLLPEPQDPVAAAAAEYAVRHFDEGGKEFKVAAVEICASPADRVAAIVQQAAAEAIAARGAFHIAIAGGSLVKMLGAMAGMPSVQWDKWHVAWVDERCVPHSDPESNYGGAREAWLSKVTIPPSQVHTINERLCEGGGGGMAAAAAAAEDYERALKSIPELPRTATGLPVFDLLLLGFGPDGHICSLFPGHALLDDESGAWVLPIADSPKPPQERITLSLPAVNSASRIVLVGTGGGKAETVRDAFAPGCDLPCARALGSAESPRGPIWVLDEGAAALLPAPPPSKRYRVSRP